MQTNESSRNIVADHASVLVNKTEAIKEGKSSQGARSKQLKRLSMNLTEQGFSRLEHLKRHTDAVTTTDVVRNALRVYEAFIDGEKRGKIAALIDEKNPEVNERVQLW